MEHGKREVAALVAVLLLGALVRGCYLSEIAAHPEFAHPVLDARFNDDWARSLVDPAWSPEALAEDGLADPGIATSPCLRPPGYPWALAATYAASGGSYLAARVVAMLLGLATALLVARVATRAFGPGAGPLAALVVALSWVPIYFEGELHEPALLLATETAALLALVRWDERPRARRALLAGALFGAAALVRSNLLAVLPVAALWMVVGARSRGRPRRDAAALLLGAALAIAPATARNALASGELVPISTNGGLNLLLGNHPGATGFIADRVPGVGPFRSFHDYPAIRRAVEAQVGHELSQRELSAELGGRALRWIGSEPGAFLALCAKRAALLLGPDEIPHNTELRLARRHSRVLRFLPSGFPVVLAAALCGLGLALLERRRFPGRARAAALLAGVAAAYLLSLVPFFAASRYRVALLPLLAPLAAHGALRTLALAREGRRRAAAGSALTFALALVVASLGPYAPPVAEAAWHLERGRAAFAAGDSDGAEREFRAALALEPRSPAAHYELAVALHARGDRAGAEQAYRAVLAVDPGHVKALHNLATLQVERGELEEGLALFRRAVAADPGFVRSWAGMGVALARAGRFAEAVEPFERAAALAPESVRAQAMLAEVLGRAGRRDEARVRLERALRDAPPGSELAQGLEAALARLGKD